MRSCASCTNLHWFEEPYQGSQFVAAGACTANATHMNAPLVPIDGGQSCVDYEPAENLEAAA
jgi:hypothetical protein